MGVDSGPGGLVTLRVLRASTLFLLLTAADVSGADAFVVIVHPSVAGANIKRGDLANVFLKKSQRWGSGAAADPVDQSGASPVRKAFSEAVVHMPVGAVLQYWQKAMLSASPTRPPFVKDSDAEVIAYVAQRPGAVGYVAASTPLPSGVKALAVID
jgi:ABC-type phosphate transport system substrate-binding protein